MPTGTPVFQAITSNQNLARMDDSVHHETVQQNVPHSSFYIQD